MNKFFGPFLAGRAAVGLLILRLVFGLGMVLHGYQKIEAGPFHWADNIAAMPIHLVIPPYFQALAMVGEFGGGLAMISGLLFPVGMAGIICTLGFALVKFHLARGAHYVSMHGEPDCELAAHYFIMAVGLLFTGPGTLSLDALIFGRRRDDPPVVP